MSTIGPFLIGYAGAGNGGTVGYSLVIGSAGIGTMIIPGLIGIFQNVMSMSLAILVFSPIFLILAKMLVFNLKTMPLGGITKT
jgi:hypothetical protein